ncbi:MAG: segregation/condensation protein A [Bdellovibrionota bacterium]
MSLQISLPKFEGPLALLLYLIRKEEMDIMDIKIHEITSQYLQYIKLMKELDLEVAAEFILMAATLIQIKSHMLLPQYNENGEIVDVDDPRKELVQKLLEYQKYQEASKLLYERPLVGRDIWLRGVRESFESQKEEEIIIEDNGLFSLISAYRMMLKTAQKRIHQVTTKVQSVASRILEFKDKLILGQKISLQDLVTDMQNQMRQTLITFLSLLELGKLGFVSLYQTEAYSTLWVEALRPIDYDVISRVEEYETVNNESLAQRIFDESEILSAEETVQHLNEDPDDLLTEDVNSVESIVADADMATDEEIEAAELEINSGGSIIEGEDVTT